MVILPIKHESNKYAWEHPNNYHKEYLGIDLPY